MANTRFRMMGERSRGTGGRLEGEGERGTGGQGRKCPMPHAQCPMPNAQCPIPTLNSYLFTLQPLSRLHPRNLGEVFVGNYERVLDGF
ncbi:hypothetical protein [Tolypothrix sp. VBCCA 56010]|uniref:hypothetical protein n=1 Tax=Tolypothrix sp. VBCCA 56010 TaxID=3137731 RepID=UPI003D7CB2C6